MSSSPGWRDRWLALRDRWLASPRFRRAAASFPATRGIARKRAAQVFDLVAGFVYSQVLFACVRLDLFELLAGHPMALDELSARLGLELDAAERLLAAAVSLKLVERRSGGRYGLGVLGAPMVNNPGIAALVEHHSLLYADLADPVGLLNGERAKGLLASYWPYANALDPSAAIARDVGPYSALMSASQPLVAEAVLDAVDFRRHRRLLDVGGGDGSFLVSVASRAPDLQLLLFDLPAVAELAHRRFAAAGLQERARALGGSFLTDELPAGADVATLVRVLHDHDDESVMTLLRAVRRALPPNGRVVIAEPMAETPGAQAMGDAYFGFYLLAMGRGRPRTQATLERMLSIAGFVAIRHVQTAQPLQTRLLVAQTPFEKTLNG